MPLTTLFFDLDATLYSSSNGLWDEIRQRIYQYMREEVGIKEEDIPATRDHYWSTYGTTLEGLRIHHQVDPAHYLAYVHAIPLENYLLEDQELRQILASLPQKLWVFTNADRAHASAVLKALGIQDLFSGIVDLLAMEYAVKPQPQAFQIALRLAGENDPGHCLLFDDLPHNLLAARSLGFATALVGNASQADGADYCLPTIHDIKDVIPELWNGS